MRDNSELTLRKQSDFARIYKRGRSKGSRYVVVIYRNNNVGYTRTAFVASKKVGNSVERNRSRRLMREAYRAISENVVNGADIIMIARSNITDASERDVERCMYGVFRSCGLFK